jgi:hypothetical protein
MKKTNSEFLLVVFLNVISTTKTPLLFLATTTAKKKQKKKAAVSSKIAVSFEQMMNAISDYSNSQGSEQLNHVRGKRLSIGI